MRNLIALCVIMLCICIGACSNPVDPGIQPDLTEISIRITGTAEKCRVHYVISEGEFTDWVVLDEFPWIMNLSVERSTYIEVELNSLSYGGYFDLSVYANGQWYTIRTDEPYDWISLKIMVE